MATPVSNSVDLTGFAVVDGLLQGSSWSLPSNNVLKYSLHNLVPNSVWTQTEMDAVRRAFDAWEAVANIEFVRVGGSPTNAPELSGADLAISFTGLSLSELIEPGALGVAVYPDPQSVNSSFYPGLSAELGTTFNRSNYPQPEGDIFIDDFSDFWFPRLDDGEIGFVTILHEIGHALGLKHPHDNLGGRSFSKLGIGELDIDLFTVMSYNHFFGSEGVGNPATPMQLDILAIQYIYGPNMSYHTGHDAYVLADDGVVRTIWDAGGYDTFSALSVGHGVLMDLGDWGVAVLGNFSITAIALGVTIEKAIGSQFDDEIVGNSVANSLKGAGGDDTISGLAGSDEIVGGNGNDRLFGGDGVDRLTGDAGDDFLQGNKNGDKLFGGDGLDELRGGQGRDYIQGNDHGDLLIGAKGDDELRGGKGRDTLRGSKEDDILIGGQGNDTLNGGTDDDELWGMEGEDVFVFDQPGGAAYSGSDTIHDFEPGVDNIQLAAFVNDTDIQTAGDVLGRISSDGAGGSEIDLGDGNAISLSGVDPSLLSEDDFLII